MAKFHDSVLIKLKAIARRWTEQICELTGNSGEINVHSCFGQLLTIKGPRYSYSHEAFKNNEATNVGD